MSEPDLRRGSIAPPTRVRYAVLLSLCSLAFLTYLDRICIMRVQGEIERDLELGRLTAADEAELQRGGLANDSAAREALSRDRATQRMGWIFTAFLIGYGLFEVPCGWLGDRLGARLVITRIVVWWSVFTALTGSVASVIGWFSSDPAPWLLVAAMILVRFLFGAGEAGAFPNIARALGRWFPFRDRGGAQGAVWLSSRIGGALAPTLTGLLMAWSGGWRQAFWLLGGVGIIWALAFFLWFRDRPEEMPAVNEAEREWIRADAAGAGSIYDDHCQASVPWGRLVTSTNLLAIYVVGASISFAWYFFVTFSSKYLKEQFGVDYSQSEVMSGLPLLCGGVGCLAGGRLSDYLIRRLGSKRWGRSLPGLAGFVLAGLTALCIPWLPNAGLATAGLCLICVFQDLAVPCLWSLPADVGGRYAGTVGGCMNTAGSVGGALGILIVAWLSRGEAGWSNVFMMFGAVYLASGLLWLYIDASRGLLSEKSEGLSPGP